jgi:putative (di)nucleoside polyphosphate hydrolase
MRRELFEETGIRNIKIIKKIEKMYEYELPKNLIGIIWKGRYRGQQQKWFITKFLGNDDEINLNTGNPEFIEWKWVDAKILPDVIVDFKKNLYVDLLKEIKLVIG